MLYDRDPRSTLHRVECERGDEGTNLVDPDLATRPLGRDAVDVRMMALGHEAAGATRATRRLRRAGRAQQPRGEVQGQRRLADAGRARQEHRTRLTGA